MKAGASQWGSNGTFRGHTTGGARRMPPRPAEMTPSERRRGMRRRTSPAARVAARVAALLAAGALAGASLPAQARKGPPIIRDAEIEQLLKEYAQPILRVAGLTRQNIQVVIVNDSSFNAFVADGRRIFINGGALLDADTPNQVIGVLAHETGHIAGGHLARLREQLASASTQSILAMILGVGAMVAGARSSNGGWTQGGMAAITAPGA